MSSLTSQESNDICKLTDRQQAEYHSAYLDYISHMAQLEATGPNTEDKAKDGEQEGRKPFKKSAKAGDSMLEFSINQDASLLHPITEEDEKPERKSSVSCSRGPGPRYHSVPNEEEEEECAPEETDATPLLWDEPQEQTQRKTFIPGVANKKESSDSGMRSSGSSSSHSLRDVDNEETHGAEKPTTKTETEEEHLSLVRMSICSEALSEASSPEETWVASQVHTEAVTNLNHASINRPPLNDNSDTRNLIICPGSSTDTQGLLNHNLLNVHLKRSSGGTQDNEERESVL